MKDHRYDLMRERLSQLRSDQLLQIVDNIDIVLFDEYNYYDGRFCPMGVALRCHELPNPTDLSVKEMIGKRFTPTNMLKGVTGEFYHGTDEERRRDLLALCNELLQEKYESLHR